MSNAPRTIDEFMAQALAMERDAVARYTEFAEAMEVHHNPDVAKMFRTMAGYEAKHAQQILDQMGWKHDPAPPPGGYGWAAFEAPETVPADEVHYLMQPMHALELALAAEERAEAFFAELARITDDEKIRRAALELQEEEKEHVELVRAWMKKVPQPDHDWHVDPDPPRHHD